MKKNEKSKIEKIGIFIGNNLLFISSVPVLLFVFWALFNVYMNRLGSFGCFDDCNNFMRGYFILKGKALFSEIFSGHMPLMNYISFFIQKLAPSNSIYQLLFSHTIFLFVFSFISCVFLIIRFKWSALGFILFYELFKMYLFGDRFLAEGIIIYPLVYMTGLAWYRVNKRKTEKIEYFAAGILTWFIIFMREPYIPLVLFLYGIILYGKDDKKYKIFSVLFFVIISMIFVLLHSLPDFIFQVFTLNRINIATELNETRTGGIGFLKTFLYPLIVLFGGEWNIIRIATVALSVVLFIFSFDYIRQRKFIPVLFVFFILGLANLRYVEPGTTFYSAYHLLIWYGTISMLIFLLASEAKMKFKMISFSILVPVLLWSLFNGQNILWERVDTTQEIHDGFAVYSIAGRVIRTISQPDYTLFVDGGDDLIYWRADLPSAYKYSWYTSLMPYHEEFRKAREDMFRNYPPDVYYGNCRKGYFLPQYLGDEYINIKKKSGNVSCIYLRKDNLKDVNEKAWGELDALEYSL